MNIFKKISRSVYSPEFYTSLKSTSTKSVIGFYLKLALLLAIIPSIFISISFISELKSYLSSENVSTLVEKYPSDLVVKAENGQFSTNAVEPYYVPAAEPKEGEAANYLVIDTTVESFSTGVLADYQTMVLITKDSVIYEKDGSLQVTPLEKDFTYELNKQKVVDFTAKAVPVLKVLIYFLPILIFVSVFIGYTSFLFPFLLLALITWLVLRLKKIDVGYKHAYRVTLHAMVIGLILDMVYGIIMTSSIPSFVLAIVAIIVVLINVRKGGVSVPVTGLTQ